MKEYLVSNAKMSSEEFFNRLDEINKTFNDAQVLRQKSFGWCGKPTKEPELMMIMNRLKLAGTALVKATDSAVKALKRMGFTVNVNGKVKAL